VSALPRPKAIKEDRCTLKTGTAQLMNWPGLPPQFASDLDATTQKPTGPWQAPAQNCSKQPQFSPLILAEQVAGLLPVKGLIDEVPLNCAASSCSELREYLKSNASAFHRTIQTVKQHKTDASEAVLKASINEVKSTLLATRLRHLKPWRPQRQRDRIQFGSRHPQITEGHVAGLAAAKVRRGQENSACAPGLSPIFAWHALWKISSRGLRFRGCPANHAAAEQERPLRTSPWLGGECRRGLCAAITPTSFKRTERVRRAQEFRGLHGELVLIRPLKATAIYKKPAFLHDPLPTFTAWSRCHRKQRPARLVDEILADFSREPPTELR